MWSGIQDAGGFVTVKGRPICAAERPARRTLRISRQLCAEMLDRLVPIVDDHCAEENLRADVDNIVRKLEKRISEILPVLH